MSGIEVRAAQAQDVAAAADVLAQAFSTDRLTVASMAEPRDPRRLLDVLFASLIRRHYLPRGAVDVAVRDGRIVGAAAWAAPGAHRFDARAMAGLFVDLTPAFTWRLIPLLVQDLRLEMTHPREPHWYLFAIGAAEPGAGIGGALLDAGLARAGSTPSYLESSTPSSARLYQRKGFRCIGTAASPPGYSRQPQMWHDGTPA